MLLGQVLDLSLLHGRAPVDDREVFLFEGPLFHRLSEPGHRRPVLDQIGTGTAWVFRDGTIIKGTWAKKDAGDLTRLYDSAGNEKDVCVKEAKAAKVHALSNAKTRLTISKADAAAGEKSADANAEASAIGTEARHDAAGADADAEYAVAREKCNGLAGDSKDRCVSDAKVRFGQR